MFPALLISLKFRKVKQAKVNRKLTNNSETLVLQKFHFSKKVEQNFDQNQYKIAVKSEERGKNGCWPIGGQRDEWDFKTESRDSNLNIPPSVELE